MRTILGVNRADRRMEVGVKERRELVRRRLKWVSLMERMGDEKLSEIRCPESRGTKNTENAMRGLR